MKDQTIKFVLLFANNFYRFYETRCQFPLLREKKHIYENLVYLIIKTQDTNKIVLLQIDCYQKQIDHHRDH